MNRFTQPHYNRITSAAERRNKPKAKRKMLREPPVQEKWFMDMDVQNMYLGGGLTHGNSMIWGNAGSGKSNIMMHFLKARNSWVAEKEHKSPFKA